MNLSVSDLKKMTDKNESKEKKVYDEIYKSINKYIIYQHEKHHKTMCEYTLKQFIPGLPLYDIPKAQVYLANKLHSNGFTVFLQNHDTIIISWDVQTTTENPEKPEQPEPQKEPGQFNYDNTGPTMDENGLTEFEMSLIRNKMKRF
jgi:hypothetical protein